MSTKTFADAEVKALLDAHFEFVSLNVDRQKEAAAWFAADGIPDV